MNAPTLKLALRSAVACNELHLGEPRKRTYHAQTEGQRKEEISKTMSTFIPHLTGLKTKSESPIHLDELIIFIASHSMIFLFNICWCYKIQNQAKKITGYLLDMFLLTFLLLYVIHQQISNTLEIDIRHNICLYRTVVLFCPPKNIRRDVHGFYSAYTHHNMRKI